jgi:hypothetical protein
MKSPSWEVDSCSKFEEIKKFGNLWKPKFYYRVQKCRPFVSILSEMYLVCTLPQLLLKIVFNIISTLKRMFLKWFLPFWSSD